jgi:hypothetical protein
MWIFTETGFLSAVAKGDTPGMVTVRARDKKSLEPLAHTCGVEIVNSPHADYPYRVFVPSEDFATWVSTTSGEISYNNFKSRVSKTRGYGFAHALHDVWAAMLQVEDAEARR